MKEKINQIKKEYSKIVKKISQPQISRNIPELQKLSRQKAELERILLDFEKLNKVKKQITKLKSCYKKKMTTNYKN